MSRPVVIGVVALGIVALALALNNARPACPADWAGAQRIEIKGSSADVALDGHPYRVGGRALLDYMPRTGPPFPRPGEHPMGVNMSISAPNTAELDDPEFTCVRVTRGSGVWTKRPDNYGAQTSQSYPAGEAWRNAYAYGGPEWPVGDVIGVELWATVRGQRYVFVLEPFALMKGG